MLLMQFFNELNNIKSVWDIFIIIIINTLSKKKNASTEWEYTFTNAMNSGRATVYPVSSLFLSIYRIPRTCLEHCLH